MHSAQKNSHNFIVFAEMMQKEQKTVDFFSIKVYLRIKIWIQNQISKIINQKCQSCVMTNFMSNTATTALMVPIGISIAQGMGADPSAVLMACVIGGSCAYATPIGMPANTMVVTAGGYTFKDYAKAGVPMILVATVVSMILLPIFYPFFPG